MKRREFIKMITGSTAAWPLTARAQQPARLRHIAIWMGRAEDAEGQRHATAFRQGLQVLGWTDGRNIRTDYRWVRGDVGHLPTIAKEMIGQRPDVILAETTPAVAALSRESRTIPIVFVNVSDPIGSGFVTNLANPGGIITGFTSNEPTLGSKWPELLKEIAPGVKRIGFIFNPETSPMRKHSCRLPRRLLLPLGLGCPSPFKNDAELERVIGALASEPGGSLIVLPEPTTNVRSDLIAWTGEPLPPPAIYAFRYQATGGGLISYGVDLAESFREQRLMLIASFRARR